MAKKNLTQPTTLQVVVVVVLGLSIIFNIVTFRMLLEETRQRTEYEGVVNNTLLDNFVRISELKACVDGNVSPCELKGASVPEN